MRALSLFVLPSVHACIAASAAQQQPWVTHVLLRQRCCIGGVDAAAPPPQQVSVRKASLVALSRLLELMPCEAPLCHAWVAAALPLVRDVEAGIQVRLLCERQLLRWVALVLPASLRAACSVQRAAWRTGRTVQRRCCL